MDSILTSIKKMLGIDGYYEHFDQDLIIHINSVFAILSQLGVGSCGGFYIKDSNDKWSDILGDNKTIELVKTYVYLKVKLIFDPPQSSFAIESIKNLASELEWRINVAVDPNKNLV